jgi:hypothetical protein
MKFSAMLIPGICKYTRHCCVWALCLVPALLAAQPAAPGVDSSLFGFSYHLPADWRSSNENTALPAAKQSAVQSTEKMSEKVGVACAQVVLSARHGAPPSVVVAVALPFACYGQPMTKKDLPGFAAGASEGLKQNFNVSNSVNGDYTLGSHDFWIERAVGIPKNHPKSGYTLEMTCTILRKAAVCWMTMAADDGSLRDFETSLVTLDGEPPLALVPINAFAKKQPEL